jgi:transcriptional regulator with GAF, ATPase, and Fis domain
LRVLQESEFERVGDDRTRTVDVRVIAATNRNLKKLVAAGEFREDLFYRLSVFPIEVPPLRKRREDIIALAQHFLKQTCADFGRKPMNFTRAQAAEIAAYDWPGNVRELKNVIERAVILSKGSGLRLDLSLEDGSDNPVALADEPPSLPSGTVRTEREMIAWQKENLIAALEQANWRVSGKGGAAEILGVRPTTLSDRIKSFGIKNPGR